jgi:hypothetical protein
MLKKARIISMAAAALLGSPAFAGEPLAQAAPAEHINTQRIIREIVVNGRLIDAGSDEALANEFGPSWLGQSSALDRSDQHSW